MEIKRGNTVIAEVYLQSNSFVEEEVMGNHIAQLTFVSRHALELMIGDSITAGGNDYKIRNNEKVEKKETSLGWHYTVTFYSSQYELQDVSFFLHGTSERKKNFDYYNGTATQWLTLILENMNRGGSGWQAGSVIESGHINMSFKDKSCASVLTDLCKELDTEYWISGKTISIGRREYAANGLRLGQGEGMGFKDLTLTAVSDTPPITVLYPYGSDKNLTKEYGHDYLVLPGGKLSIEKNVELYGHREQSVSFDDIFPKREFKVTQKTDNVTLRSTDIDFNLTDYLIQDTEAIVTFQDGDLAGYDLAVVEGTWNNAVKEFRLKPNAEENALNVPGDINFKVGDTFILTNIRMPQRYIDEAEAELLAKATEHLESICDKQVQLAGKCDDILFKQLGIHIACGQMVGVLSDELNINREIRCTKVKKYLENDREPYRYEITVSDFLRGNGLRDLINEVKNVPDEISKSVVPVKQFTKRTWQDAMQTREMLFDPESDFFTEMIQPLAVHTAQLIVGTNSQQMSLAGVKFTPNADDNPNYFKSTAGKLEHFTVNPDGTIRTWTIPASSYSLDNSKAYYVYAKCVTSGSTGAILVTERKIKLEEEAGYYHFLIGILNTPMDNVRSWQPMYGYTEIAGQQITTGIIKDRLARLIIDLTEGVIYGKVTFKAGSSGLGNVEEWPQVEQDIKDAQETADNAIREIEETNAALAGFETTVNTTFKDGIISEAEAISIEKYINSLNTEKANVDASYNRLYANAYLTGTTKTNLSTAKTAYNTAHANLISAINTAIADKKTTTAEKANVDSKFALYKTALSDYSTAVENANKAIQDYLESKVEAKLDILDDRIEANVTRIDAIGNQIETAGWITAAQGNTLYATKSEYNSLNSLVATHTSRIEQNAESIALKVSYSDYNGNTIASLINQTATTIQIQASKINLNGTVSFSMFNSSLQSLINNKADASVLSNYIPVGEVQQAMKDEGLIVGGYMKMSLIDTNSIYANMAKIGGFTIDSGNLTWSQSNYFGSNPRTIRMGIAKDTGGAIDISFDASTPGAFGVKSVGRNVGGAAIYASSQSTQKYPDSSSTWAGYFDGWLHATVGRFDDWRIKKSDGSYTAGVSFGTSIDLDKVRFEVVNGLIVRCVSE
jgi:hypothetical protein